MVESILPLLEACSLRREREREARSCLVGEYNGRKRDQLAMAMRAL